MYKTISKSVRYCANCKKKIKIGDTYFSGRGLPATLCSKCAEKVK